MDFWIIISLILIGFGSSFIQRVCGFGISIFAMLFLPYFNPMQSAVSIASLLSCITPTYNTLKYRKEIPYKTVFPLLLSALVVITIAVYFSTKIASHVFTVLLGVVLILLSIYFLAFDAKIRFTATPWKGVVAGAIGGVLGGLFSTGGPPAVLYMTHAENDNLKYFAGIQFHFCVTSIYSVIMRAINRLITLQTLTYVAVAVVGCFAGDFVGKLVFNKLDEKKLKKVIYIGMLLSGCLMLL